MYTPAHFEQKDVQRLAAVVRAWPLAALVATVNGELVANHVPMLVTVTDERMTRLRGHVARANPLWRVPEAGVPALAVFRSADAYVSPSAYPSKGESGRVVPTWNYAAVHVHGTLRAIDDAAWLAGHVRELTDAHETGRAGRWRVDDAPVDYLERMLRAIVGIELDIERVEGKFKLSQNRTRDDREGAASWLGATGNTALAALMRESDPG